MRMSIAEAAAIGLAALSLAQRSLSPGAPEASLGLIALAAGAMLLALAMNPRRWPLAPAVVALLIIAAQLALNRDDPAVGLTALPAAVAGALLLSSTALAWGAPAGPLPSPQGPYKVGVATGEISRPDRRLSVKVWYPAAAERRRRRREPLWSEVHGLKELPAFVRGLLAYLKGVRTRSLIGAAPAAGQSPHPLIIYNHSLLSFASENTLLIEWLASHGYVVLAVRHREQAAEHAALQAAVTADERGRDRKLMARLKKASSRQDRAQISLELFANSTGVSAIVRRRAEDSAFVLDHLDQALEAVPGGPGALAVSREHIGALGLSVGGAVATRLCQTDARCHCAANLDGGLYGVDQAGALPPAYLMIYSQDSAGTNDGFRRDGSGGFVEHVLGGAKHLDLHDAAVVLPCLRWFGALGGGNAEARSLWVKRTVTAFFDDALRGSPSQQA